MQSQPPIDSSSDILKKQFPSRDQGQYFNHAAIAPWPANTAEAVCQFAGENAHQGPARYAEWIALENRLREQLCALVGAESPRDIALLKNTTEGISTVAWGLDWKAGENLVLPQEEFSSNRLPWLAQAESGVEIREINIRESDHAETALINAMDENTRLLAVSSVQWSDGFRLDLAALGAACKARGVLFFVDAIQQLGALRLDVSACHINFLAADAHKWMLGPEGIAVFYSDPQSRPLLRLRQLGWHMFDNPWGFGREEWTPADTARRFEAGSPNSLGQVALSASLELLSSVGMEQVEQRVLNNTDCLMQRLQDLPGISLKSRTAPMRRSGIVSFTPAKVSANRLHRALAIRGISCAVRDQGIRLSPHFYQGAEEIEVVLEVIRQELEKA